MDPMLLDALTPVIMRAHRWRNMQLGNPSFANRLLHEKFLFPFYGDWVLLTTIGASLEFRTDEGRRLRLDPDSILLVDGARIRLVNGAPSLFWRLDFELVSRPRQPTREVGGYRPVNLSPPHPTGMQLFGQDMTMHITGDLGRKYAYAIRRICDLWWSPEGSFGMRVLTCQGRLGGILAEILEGRFLPGREPCADPVIEESTRIAERCFDYGLTVPVLAGMVGLSTSVFNTRFLAARKQSAGAYLRNLRYQTSARYLLENPDQSLALIARKCSFNSVQSFVAGFRRIFGKSPDHWRQEQLERDARTRLR